MARSTERAAEAAAAAHTAQAADETAAAAHEGLAELGYEAARDELVGIVERLEGGRVGLEESLVLWRRAEALAGHCQRWLERAEAEVSSPTSPSSSRA